MFKHRQPTYIYILKEFFNLIYNHSVKEHFKSEWLAENLDHIIMTFPLCKHDVGDFYLPNSNASANLVFWKYISNLLINFQNLLSEYTEKINKGKIN